MSNRFGERINPSGGSGPPGGCQNVQNCPGTILNDNIVQWGGVDVTKAAVKTDDVPSDGLTSPVVPEIGAILEIFDGMFLQRARATLDRVLLVAEEYFRRGEDFMPTQTSVVDDSLRVKGAEVPRQFHLNQNLLPVYPVFTGQAPFMLPRGVTEVVFFGVFVAGSKDSFPRLRVLLGDGFDEAPQPVINTALTIAVGNGRESAYVYEIDLVPGDGTFVLPVKIPRGVTSVRLVASEAGDPLFRGGLALNLVAGT